MAFIAIATLPWPSLAASDAVRKYVKRSHDKPILSRMMELITPANLCYASDDKNGLSPTYNKTTWNAVCAELLGDIGTDPTLSKEENEKQKVAVTNVVNALCDVRDTDVYLQLPSGDGTGSLRDLNEYEYMLTANLLGKRLRELGG